MYIFYFIIFPSSPGLLTNSVPVIRNSLLNQDLALQLNMALGSWFEIPRCARNDMKARKSNSNKLSILQIALSYKVFPHPSSFFLLPFPPPSALILPPLQGYPKSEDAPSFGGRPRPDK